MLVTLALLLVGAGLAPQVLFQGWVVSSDAAAQHHTAQREAP